MRVLFVILLLIVILLMTNVVIVPQTKAFVIEFLGQYQTTWRAGLHVKIPFLSRIIRRVDMRERVSDFPPQPVITKDNVTMMIDTVVYLMVTDPKKFTYGVENPINALENLTATTLRNIIGDMELDATLTSRDIINNRMCVILDEATDPWGIKVTRVELKNIKPPAEIQEAMEKQMKAERERREAILRAEGEKKAAILKAEGEKESAILRAEALKTQMIKEAEGHKESIRLHKEAEALGVKMLREAGLSSEQIVRLQSLDSFEKVADGNATKIIIPSDLQNMAGLVNALKESTTEK
ncbi:MAG: SPFH/Band 7/PHB domain protein [Lachnospiraceae bacterium]|nr:SPFH/Band 7/PHB domain protein [Lachnospiraceae bacterium]